MEENKRATKGTEHTLQGNEKIGGEFTKEANAPFIKERSELWDKLYAAQEEKINPFLNNQLKLHFKMEKKLKEPQMLLLHIILEKNIPKNLY